jgi:acyl-coenzyme A synthetase/AMP-(fatty) acid ligase
VSPREVEAAIQTLPDVAAVAVVGVRDALLGQTIKAFVVRQHDAKVTEGDVLRSCREHLESYMIPHEVAFVDTLPTTLTGKVRRKALAGNEPAR